MFYPEGGRPQARKEVMLSGKVKMVKLLETNAGRAACSSDCKKEA